jgi:hypothetical protein
MQRSENLGALFASGVDSELATRKFQVLLRGSELYENRCTVGAVVIFE